MKKAIITILFFVFNITFSYAQSFRMNSDNYFLHLSHFRSLENTTNLDTIVFYFNKIVSESCLRRNELHKLSQIIRKNVSALSVKKELRARLKNKVESQNKGSNEKYKSSLESIYNKDQKFRKKKKKKEPWDNTVDSLNFICIKKLMDEYGLPNICLVGNKGVAQFEIIINHAIFDSTLVTIDRLNRYLDEGCMSPFWFAFAVDKFLVFSKKEDPFFYFVPHKNWNILTPEEKEGIVDRRKLYGLEKVKIVSFQ
jgi:hypothetical protein